MLDKGTVPQQWQKAEMNELLNLSSMNPASWGQEACQTFPHNNMRHVLLTGAEQMPVHRIGAAEDAAWRIGWALAGQHELDLGVHTAFAVLQLQTASISPAAVAYLQVLPGMRMHSDS